MRRTVRGSLEHRMSTPVLKMKAPRAASPTREKKGAPGRSGPGRGVPGHGIPGQNAPEQGTPGQGIGRVIRMTRLARGLLLRQVAEAAGCSEGLLSRIENDKADPSLKMLHRICAVLDLKVGDLLSWGEKADAVVVRRAERVARHFRRDGGPGAVIECLSLSGKLVMGYLNTLASGASTGELLSHPGEELGYVVKGRVELVVGEEVHVLAAGDSFFFHSDTPHGYRNPWKTQAQFIVVNAPPTF